MATPVALTMQQRTVAVRGIDMAYADWGDAGSPVVLLVHATGFHGRCWDAVARDLGDGVRALAPDFRGHGRSTQRGPYDDLGEFSADLAAFVEALDLEGIVAVGHSMGGHCTLQAMARIPDRFSKLLLVDPLIRNDPALQRRARPRAPAASIAEHPVARRRNAWASPEEMFEQLRERHPFRLWRDDVLMDYCRHGLVPDGDGFVLACPPLVEAAIYMGTAGREIGDVIATLPHPTVVLRARRGEAKGAGLDFSQSQTWPGLADALPNARDVYLPDLTHYMPMQRPDLIAAHIQELL